MFSKVFKAKPPKSYEEQKKALDSANVRERVSLAGASDTNKEILYYLAEKDPDPKVRKAVAQNEAMPVQASTVLASDSDVDVRIALAGRLVELLPDVSEDRQSQLYAFVVQALGTLALDEVLKIRIALSSTLKDHAHTPPKIAGQLARDVEREVSEPILRVCTALSDEDLLDILKSHPAQWVIEAVASRPAVSEEVSEAVIDTQNESGGSALISNEGASLSNNLLQKIVDVARKLPEWHKPIAVRKSLPVSVAKQLAEYVDASVRDLLMSRGDFDEATTEEIAAVFRRRVDFADEVAQENPKDKTQRLLDAGALDENAISDALAMRENEFVTLALAHMAGTQADKVTSVFEMKTPKPIVALTWRAGLSMRLALQLQKEMGHIPPKELLYPKDGTDYPLTQDELDWQLEFLGLKAT